METYLPQGGHKDPRSVSRCGAGAAPASILTFRLRDATAPTGEARRPYARAGSTGDSVPVVDLRGNEWRIGEPRERLISVGEEFRAKRARLGLELADVERVLRIKCRTLLAMEAGELEAFPNQGVIPGHVRSYARYLGLDPEHSYRRLCRETGFTSPSALIAAAEITTAGGRRVAFNNPWGTCLATSRFAVRSGKPTLAASLPADAIAITLGVILTVLALIYGADSVLRYLQQTGLTYASASAAAQHRGWHTPLGASGDLLQVSALGGGALALVSQEPFDVIPSRDGPISALDPELSGLFSNVAAAGPAGRNGGGAPARLTPAHAQLDPAPSRRELVLAQTATVPDGVAPHNGAGKAKNVRRDDQKVLKLIEEVARGRAGARELEPVLPAWLSRRHAVRG